jgi:hypothetical protein
MMAALEARGAAIAAEAQQRAIATLAERAQAELAGVSVEAEADGLVLSGRGLARRLVDEPALRWIGSLMR